MLKPNEPTHAIKAAIDEALDAKAKGEERVILFGLSGHGHFDMQAYDDYLANLKSLLETGDVMPQAPWEMHAELRAAQMARNG